MPVYRRTLLVRYRKAMGYTQTTLATTIGANRSTIVRWESGETDPTGRRRQQLADLFRISLRQLDAILAIPPQARAHRNTHPQPGATAVDEPYGVHVTTTALVTDYTGAILMIQPAGRNRLSLPTGIIKPGDTPHTACARTVRDHLGLRPSIRNLLVVDTTPPAHPPAPPITIDLIFDAGTLPTDPPARPIIRTTHPVILLPPHQVTDALPDEQVQRIHAALHARQTHEIIYLPGGPGTTSVSGIHQPWQGRTLPIRIPAPTLEP